MSRDALAPWRSYAYNLSVTPQRTKRTSALTAEQDERVRDLLRELVAKDGSQSKTAKRIGYNQAVLSAYLGGKHRAGLPFALAIIEASGLQIWDVLDVPAPPLPVEPDRYPNRGKAVVAARVVELSGDAIAVVQALSLREGEADPPARWWLEQILRAEDARRGPRLV